MLSPYLVLLLAWLVPSAHAGDEVGAAPASDVYVELSAEGGGRAPVDEALKIECPRGGGACRLRLELSVGGDPMSEERTRAGFFEAQLPRAEAQKTAEELARAAEKIGTISEAPSDAVVRGLTVRVPERADEIKADWIEGDRKAQIDSVASRWKSLRASALGSPVRVAGLECAGNWKGDRVRLKCSIVNAGKEEIRVSDLRPDGIFVYSMERKIELPLDAKKLEPEAGKDRLKPGEKMKLEFTARVMNRSGAKPGDLGVRISVLLDGSLEVVVDSGRIRK